MRGFLCGVVSGIGLLVIVYSEQSRAALILAGAGLFLGGLLITLSFIEARRPRG